MNALKHYFNVTNSYVVNKLGLVLFPWRHRPWIRQNYDGFYLPPREDINSPDMYIPGKTAWKVRRIISDTIGL